MARPRSRRLRAIVLDRTKLAEQDLILTMLSKTGAQVKSIVSKIGTQIEATNKKIADGIKEAAKKVFGNIGTQIKTGIEKLVSGLFSNLFGGNMTANA